MGLNWIIGGPQGSGVDSAAQLFAMSVAHAGLHVVGQREYYSNIMGKHSYYKIRASDKPIHCAREKVEMLAAYDEETLIRHVHSGDIVDGGAVLYAEGLEEKSIDRMPNLDRRVKEAAMAELEDLGLEPNVEGMLDLARQRGLHCLALPIQDLLAEVGEAIGKDPGKLGILRNMLAVGASLGLLGLPQEYVEGAVKHIFRSKPEVHEMNIVAAGVAADFANKSLDEYRFRLPQGEPKARLWLQGTQAVALGKMLAGCRFHTYYPISPATDEATFLEAHPESDIVVVQTEDEIAAATMAIGAALTGARASTSTSGPGFCLMTEAIGWAGMCEAPIVIVDYQRGGPSTGLPTRTEQGDMQFALRMGHSDFPRIVVAPGDVNELFEDTIRAFDWADRYQTPVILLPDKAMAGNSCTIDDLPLETTIDRGAIATAHDMKAHGGDGKYQRFHAVADGVTPRSLLGQEGGIHWLTGDEHTPGGHITEDPEIRDVMMAKRLRKLERAAQEIPANMKASLTGPADADVTIVAWGGTKGAILEALEHLEAAGVTANYLRFHVMSPFPQETEKILQAAKRLVCIEENATGHLRDLIAERTGIRIPHLVTKTNGRPTMPGEVVDAVHHALDGAPKVVMRHGV